MAAPKRPLAKPDQDKPKYIDPFVYGDSGRRIIISPGTNPITQLGQTAGSKFREYEDDDLNIRGMYLPPQTVNEIEYEGGNAPPESRSAQFFAEKHPDKDPLQIDDIMITLNGVENNQTAIHEFMHRGFERLRNAYDRDEIESRFDRSVANILFEPDYEHYLVQSVLEDEGIESTNNYTENVTKSSKEKLAKTVEALNELASDEMGMLGFQTEKDSGPKTRPKRKPKKEKKSFFRRLFNFSEGGDVPSLNPKARPRTKTEEKTLRGRPVWIDHTGEVTGEKGSKYSEVTTTIPWGTEWITAPSIDENGKRLSDDEVKQRLLETRGKDFITGEELPTFSNPEKASEYAMWRSDTMFDQEAIEQGFPEEFPMGPEPERKDFIDRSIDKGKDFLEYLTTPSKHGVFNKGGAVMNEQMEMAFMQQGGLKDDGMKRDPVSGNEVPNGSMASEVRDDIPAQLSEGEYVVPADVVRYLGVKHFEDLRNKAKSGLQNMEANGRIGGEPVPVGGPQMAEGGDLSPDEMNEIKMLMNQGGMVAGAAEGADFGQKFMTQPSVYGGGFSWEDTPGGTPSGVSIADPELPTETPESCELRGMVYNPETKMCEVPIEASPVVKDTGPSINDEQEAAPDPTSWMDSYNYTDVQSILDSSTKALEGPESGTFGALVNRVFGGGIFGVLGQAGTAAQIAANVKILESIGATEEAATLKGKLDGFIKSNDLSWIPGFMIDGDQLAAGATSKLNIENLTEHYGAQKRMDAATEAAFGAARAKELSEKYGGTSSKDPSASGFTSGYLEAMTAPERKKLTKELTKTAEKKREEFKASQANDDGPSAAQIAAANAAASAQTDFNDDDKDKSDNNLGSSSAGAGTGGFGGGGGGGVYAGGRATGGLVSRPKKKKK